MKTGILNWRIFFILMFVITAQAGPAYCINPPGNLVAYATSPTTAVVKWSNSDQTATTFYLCQSMDGITFTLAGQTPIATPPQTYLNVTGLTPNTGYFLDIETSNDCSTISDTDNAFYVHTAGYLTSVGQAGGASSDSGTGVDVLPLMIKSNSAGAYVVVGTIGGDAGTVNFNNNVTLAASATATNYYIVEYSASGLAQWAKTITMTDDSSITGYTINAVAIDASGNVAVTGQYFNGTTTYPFANKYSSTGTVSWSAPKTITTTPQVSADNESLMSNAVVIDTAGNVWITGQGEYTDANSNDITEAIIYQFSSSAGTATLESHFTGTSNVLSTDSPTLNAEGNDISLDSTGTNVDVTGYLSYEYEDGSGNIDNERNDLLFRAGGTSSGTNYTIPGPDLTQSQIDGYSLEKDSSGNFYVLADDDEEGGAVVIPNMYKLTTSVIDALDVSTTSAAYTGTNVTLSSVSSSPTPIEGSYSLKAIVSSAGAGSIINKTAVSLNLSSSPTLTFWDYASKASEPFNFFVQDTKGNQSYWTLTTNATLKTWQQEVINLFNPSGNNGTSANLAAIQYYGFSSMAASTTYNFDTISILNTVWPNSVTVTPSVMDSMGYASQAAAQAAYTGTSATINYSTTAATGSSDSLMITPTASTNSVINNNTNNPVSLDLSSFPTLITLWDRASGASQTFTFFVQDYAGNQDYWTLKTNATANTWQQDTITLASPSGNNGTPPDLTGITNFGFSQMPTGTTFNFDAVTSENISWAQDETDAPYVTTFLGASLRLDSNGNPWSVLNQVDIRKYSSVDGSLLWTKYGDPNVYYDNPGIVDGAFSSDSTFIDGMQYSTNAAAQAAYTTTGASISTMVSSSSFTNANGSSYSLVVTPSSSTNQVINSSAVTLNLSSASTLTLWDRASAASKSFRFFLQDASGHQSYWTLTSSSTAGTWVQASITLASPTGNNGTAANLSTITNYGFSTMATSTTYYFDTLAYPTLSLMTVGSFSGKDNAFDQLTMNAIGDDDMFLVKYSDLANFSDQTISPTGAISINCGGPLCPDLVTISGISASGGSGMGAGSAEEFSDDNGVIWPVIDNYSTTSPATWAFSSGSTGNRQLLAEYMDSYNNWSPIVSSSSLSVDSILPTCTLAISQAPATCSAAVTLTLNPSVSDPNSGGWADMQFSSNNGSTWSTPVTYSQTSSYTLASTGNTTVSAKVKDAAGNWSNACGALISYNTSYTIKMTAGTNGSVSPAGTKGVVTVTCGGSQTFTITPSAGYVVSQLMVDSVAQTPPPASYTFNTVMASHTISASFAVPVAPKITAQPASEMVTAPATAMFTVAASGMPSPTYQWQQSTNGGSTWTPISGATSASYTTAATSASNSGTQFNCVVTNTQGSATSNAAILTVDYAPTITSSPVSQTVNSGSTVTFTAAASGNPAPAYQWQVSTNGGTTYTPISGATSPSYTTPATTSTNNGAEYECVATSTAGSATSNAAILTVDYAPSITTQPTGQTVALGNSATFACAASGNPAPAYQWQVSTNSGTSYAPISGATSPSYTTPATTSTSNGTEYECVVTNTAGSATSNAASLTLSVLYSVSFSSLGNGSITCTSAGSNCTPACSFVGRQMICAMSSQIKGGASATFTATPSTFAGWGAGVCASVGTTSNVCTATINSSTSVTANFTQQDNVAPPPT